MKPFPKTIHQIWLGKNPFPPCAEPWRASFQKYMPDWDYKLWRDEDIAAISDQFLCRDLAMNESLGMGIRPDIIRFEILRLYGGLYLDHDMELFRPLDEIMLEDCLHFGFELSGVDATGTAILAAPQGHPFWEFYLRKIRASVPDVRPDNPWDVVQLTGPGALRRALGEWLAGNFTGHAICDPDGFVAGHLFEHGDVVGWSKEAVFPYYFTEKSYSEFRKEDYPKAYAAHHWQGEWFKEDAEYKTQKGSSAELPRRQVEIPVCHRGWQDELIFTGSRAFSRKHGSCKGILGRDSFSKILYWERWAPERLIRYPKGAEGSWWVVPMDWQQPGEEKTIFVNAGGGIGNQLFQLAYGIHLQELQGGLLRGNLTLLAGFEGVPESVTLSQSSPMLPCVHTCDDEEALCKLRCPVFSGVMLAGIFQNYEHFEVIRQRLMGILGAVPKQDVIGIHIRRGDYLQSGHYLNLSPAYYLAGVQKIMAEHPHTYREILVFSDDPDWCSAEIIPVMNLILPARVYTGSDRDTLREMKSMRGMVIPNSTFSWWGAWLADCPTVYPNVWKIPSGQLSVGLGCTLPYWYAQAIPTTP